MQVNRWELRQAWSWITAGWRTFTNNMPLWLMMAAIYLIMAILLNQIPFIGYLFLVLITPLFTAGALSLCQELSAGRMAATPATAVDWKDKLRSLTTRALKALFQIFYDPGKTLAIMVIATLALGAFVVVDILSQLLKVGGSGLPVVGGMSIRVWLPALLGLLLVWLLKITLICVALHAVFLATLRELTPLLAIEHAFKACAKNAAAMAALALILLLPMMLAAHISAFAFLLLGLIALPLLVNSVYAGAKDIYA